MIYSVPHTGTRSLMHSLGETDFKHFGQNEPDFKDEHIDFPVRDPLATSISWRSFQKDRGDMDEFRRWELAIDYLKDKDVTYHVVEELPKTEGDSGPYWAKDAYRAQDLEKLKELPEVLYLLEWMQRGEVKDFFARFYPKGFWWLKELHDN